MAAVSLDHLEDALLNVREVLVVVRIPGLPGPVRAVPHPAERRFLLHEEPQLVAGGDELLGGRVMRRTNVVAVRFPEKLGVAAPVLGAQAPAAERLHLVAADAAELHRPAVHEHPVALHLDLPESEPGAHLLLHLSSDDQVGSQGVEVGRFGVPLLRRRHVDADLVEMGRSPRKGIESDGSPLHLDRHPIRPLGQRERRLQPVRVARRLVGDLEENGQHRVVEGIVEPRLHVKTGHVDLGQGEQVELTGDAAQVVSRVLDPRCQRVGQGVRADRHGDRVVSLADE